MNQRHHGVMLDAMQAPAPPANLTPLTEAAITIRWR